MRSDSGDGVSSEPDDSLALTVLPHYWQTWWFKLAIPTSLALLLAVSSNAAETLHLFIWSEYIDPAVVTDFEKANDCKVVIDLYEESDAMRDRQTLYERRLASLPTAHDVVQQAIRSAGIA